MSNKVFINFSGGIISTGQLRLLATIIYRSNGNGAFLNNRQQFVIPKVNLNDNYLQELERSVTITPSPEKTPNIICSNNAGGFNGKNDWAYNQDLYAEILLKLRKDIQHSVSLVSPYQSLEPIFSSEINFLTSDKQDYWLIVIQKELQHFYAPFLIKTSIIPEVSNIIEENWNQTNKKNI